MLRAWWKKRRIDLYIAAVIVPSVILGVLALWALVRQYNFIKYRLKMEATLPELQSTSDARINENKKKAEAV